MAIQTIEILSTEHESFVVKAIIIGRFAVHHSIEEDDNGQNFINKEHYTVSHIATKRCAHSYPILLSKKAVGLAKYLDKMMSDELVYGGLKAHEEGRDLEPFKTQYSIIRQEYEKEYGYLYADYMPETEFD